jgi:hypothetical protein
MVSLQPSEASQKVDRRRRTIIVNSHSVRRAYVTDPNDIVNSQGFCKSGACGQ